MVKSNNNLLKDYKSSI